MGYYLGKIFERSLCQREPRPTHTHTVAPVWRAELSCPGGDGCVRSAGGRAAVCGAPAGRVPVLGAFSSSPYTVAFVLGLGGAIYYPLGPSIAVLWICQRMIDVCDSVRLLYLLTYS